MNSNIIAAAIPAAITALAGYVSSKGQAGAAKNNLQAQLEESQRAREFEAQQTELSRQFQEQQLLKQIAAQMAQSRLSADTARRGQMANAYANASSSALGGGNLQNSALSSFLQAVTAPAMRTGRF